MKGARPTGWFCWSELGTSDTKAAMEFYSKLFGWSSEDQDMGDAGIYTMLRLGGEDIGGMYELKGPMFEGVPPHWMYYVKVDDVDESAGRAEKLGAKVLHGPMDIPDVGRMVMLEDPTGAKVSMFQAKGHDGTTVEHGATSSFGWVELNTRDPERAKAFYTELFGWQAKTDKGPKPYTEWSMPGNKREPFGGMIEMDENWGDAPPCWIGYAMVDDCDAATDKATKLGARPFVPPMDIENVGRFSVLADPQGAVFATIKLSPQHKS